MRADLFFDLSTTLTGSPNLNRSRVPGLLVRLREAPEAGPLDELLSPYEAILAESSGHDELIRESIMKVPSLRTVAKLIIVLWYTGNLLSSKSSAMTEERHIEAFVWQVAHAPPPGLSGGYFGHWTYPPDN